MADGPGARTPQHRLRPGAADMSPADGSPAVDLGDGIWMSSGMSNSYLLTTAAERVVINTGMGFEAPFHKAAYDVVDDSPTRYVILTQGHFDHVGGVDRFLEPGQPGTDVVAQAAFTTWRDDNERLEAFRSRNAAFAFITPILAAMEFAKEATGEVPAQSRPNPTLTFEVRMTLEVGGRVLDLISVPGGETTDSLVIWLPEERTAFTGNVFGPLFGHVPNLVTMRGDRYRDALAYCDAVDTVLALDAERIITGHFDPIEGADVIREELTAMRDATRALHDWTVAGMNEGRTVHELMADVDLSPAAAFDVGEGYGKQSWNVRAIYEMYTGWFHHRSTAELYAPSPMATAVDVVSVAGADALVAAARTRLEGGEPVLAIQLTDLVLQAEGGLGPADPGAVAVALDAHRALLEASSNFWESAWLQREIEKLERRAGMAGS